MCVIGTNEDPPNVVGGEGPLGEIEDWCKISGRERTIRLWSWESDTDE